MRLSKNAYKSAIAGGAGSALEVLCQLFQNSSWFGFLQSLRWLFVPATQSFVIFAGKPVRKRALWSGPVPTEARGDRYRSCVWMLHRYFPLLYVSVSCGFLFVPKHLMMFVLVFLSHREIRQLPTTQALARWM